MKQAILPLIATALLFSSCARKTSSDVHLSTTTQQQEIITTRKADTLVRIPADTARGSRPLADITNDRPLVFETPTQRVTVTYDRATGNIQAEAITQPREIPIQVEETTVNRSSESAIESREVRQAETEASWWLNPWPWLLLAFIILLMWFFKPRFR